jgi:Uma2 family endonuclease
MPKKDPGAPRVKENALSYTYQDYLELPGDQRYEILEGELILVPAPSTVHQDIVSLLGSLIITYVRAHKMGKAYVSPIDVVLSEHNVLQPDIVYISKQSQGIIQEANISGAPDLVVEVLSPSSIDYDRRQKKSIYPDFGVREYWIIDPQNKSIEVLSLGPSGIKVEGVYTTGQVNLSKVLPGLQLDLDDLFAE